MRTQWLHVKMGACPQQGHGRCRVNNASVINCGRRPHNQTESSQNTLRNSDQSIFPSRSSYMPYVALVPLGKRYGKGREDPRPEEGNNMSEAEGGEGRAGRSGKEARR